MPASKDPRNKRWRYRFDLQGKRYSGSAPLGRNTKKVAEQLEREHIEKLQARAYTGVMPTVKQFVAQFLEYQRTHTKPLTVNLQTTHLEVHVVPHLGSKRLDDIGTRELDTLMTTWAATAMPRTINSRLGTLLRMFSLAVEWRILERVPDVKPLKVPQDTPRFVSQDEAQLLIESAGPRWRSRILIGLRTGLRIGELRGLQWGDIDFARSSLIVRRTDPGIAKMEANAPKGGRTRVVPLTAEAATCLRLQLALARKSRSPEATEWVWPSTGDAARTRSESGCITAITTIAERAGVEEIGWHTLRHTYASWLVQRGVPLRVVQDLLGHASIRQTERYAHLVPNAVHHAAVAGLDFTVLDSLDSTTLGQHGTNRPLLDTETGNED